MKPYSWIQYDREMVKRRRNPVKKWDVFISHATEDKDDIARPLAQGLISYKLDVWFDESEIKIGDNITEKIDCGLANSRCAHLEQKFLSQTMA